MTSVYKYLEYRKWAKDAARMWKKASPGRTLNTLAKRVGVQAPYFSNFLKEKVHLHQDQLFALCTTFALSPEEREYVSLLMEFERSGNPERQAFLKLQINEFRKRKLRSESHLKAQKLNLPSELQANLFLKPELYLIYFFLSIPAYAKQIDQIAEALRLEISQVELAVKELIELGYLELKSDQLHKTNRHFHLPKDSPLCDPHQTLLRFKSLTHQQSLPPDKRYNFAVTFTADNDTRERIHRQFLDFLTEIESWVNEAPSDEVFQMNFDLFNWS